MVTKKSKSLMFWGVVFIIFNHLFLQNIIASDQIQIKIWTDKKLYLTREPLFVHLEVENISDSTICLNCDQLTHYFRITDQKGKIYSCYVITESWGCGDTLEPREKCHYAGDIAGGYGILDDHSKSFSNYFPAGEYTFFIEMPKSSFSPRTKSNTLKIKVDEPKGDEKKAMELFIKADTLHGSKRREGAFSTYLMLGEKYPNSVYAPHSLRLALLFSDVIKDNKKMISMCKKLIEDYPDSHYMGVAFLYLVENYKTVEDKAGAIEYMKELIKKHPNTKVSERAEYWLEKIEKWEFK